MKPKAVVLKTNRDTYARYSRKMLLQAARSRPDGVVVVARMRNGAIKVDSAGMSRLELVGACFAAAVDAWCGDDE